MRKASADGPARSSGKDSFSTYVDDFPTVLLADDSVLVFIVGPVGPAISRVERHFGRRLGSRRRGQSTGAVSAACGSCRWDDGRKSVEGERKVEVRSAGAGVRDALISGVYVVTLGSYAACMRSLPFALGGRMTTSRGEETC